MTDSDISARPAAVTRRLASFCATLDIEDLPEGVVEDACDAVVDTVGAGYAGVSRDEGRRIVDYVDVYAGTGSAHVWGTDLDLLPEFAALANGTTAHVLEVDDGHRGASAHPGAPVVPAVLAMASEVDISGPDVLVAVVAGYEAMCRTATAVQPSHRQRGFHATGTTGCLGAAAALSSLLGFDEETTAHALGLAGTQAGGLFEFLERGSMAKRFHAGRAAMAGVVAARAASAGVDGPDTIIEGTDGFARAFSDEYDLSPFDSLGSPYQITRRYVKPYPCCRHVHGPIDAAKQLLADGLNPDAVTAIRVETYENAAYHDKADVANLLDAQMSMPYALAVTLDAGTATLDQFDPPRTDDRVRRLAAATEVVATDEMEGRYPDGRPVRVTVETADGDVCVAEVDYPLGAAENPLSRSAFERKFHDLTGDVLDEAHRERLLDAAFALPTTDDATTFVKLL